MGAGGLLVVRREPLHPGVERGRIGVAAPLGEQLRQAGAGEPHRRYQRPTGAMASGGKRQPATAEALCSVRRRLHAVRR
jgi:hypothetical protein